MNLRPTTPLILALLLAASAAAAQTDPVVQPVIDATRVASIQADLQRQLDRLGGGARIVACGPVLQLQQPGEGGYHQTFGASCRLDIAGRSLPALLCDDDRAAKFSLTLAATQDMNAMASFLSNNCRGAP